MNPDEAEWAFWIQSHYFIERNTVCGINSHLLPVDKSINEQKMIL